MRYFIVLLSFLLLSCNHTYTDYSDRDMWYAMGGEEKTTDVFYITPTCTWSKKDSRGVVRYNMDVKDSAQRAHTHSPSELARRALSLHSNFYCPYYAQVSMDSWGESDAALVEQRYEIAREEIINAFDYYIKNMNDGRPFILAGHSQGGAMVIELLKNYMDDEVYKKMIAAYVIGYPINSEDLKCKYIVPATSSDDTGVVVAYNSTSTLDAASPIFKGNELCINPVSWTYDTIPAISQVGDTVSLDTAHHTLIVKGVDVDAYYVPSASFIIPRGNLHIAEYDLYMKELGENTLNRINSFIDND